MMLSFPLINNIIQLINLLEIVHNPVVLEGLLLVSFDGRLYLDVVINVISTYLHRLH